MGWTKSIGALLAGLMVTAISLGADWPQWRGPKRDAVSTETGLLREWPKDGPKQVWKASGVGGGYASVAIADGRLYTLGDRRDGSYVICLDVTSGKEKWAAKVGRSGSNSTPTVDGDLVVALSAVGDLACFEAKTGKELWRKNFKKDWGGKESDNWGCSEAPLIDGDKVVVTPGGRQATMVALNKRSGAEIWKGTVPGNPTAGHASIVVATVGGVRQYVNLTAGGVVAFDSKDGKFLWKYGDDGKLAPNTANIPTCIVKGDRVFCSAGYGKGGALLQMVPSPGGVKVEEVWFERKLNNKHGGWVLVGDYLYGGRDDSPLVQCADWKTGDVVWEKKERSAGSGSAAIAYADGRLYVRYENGVMALVEASPKGFNEISAFKIPNSGGSSWSHPVVWDGKLFLKEQGNLYCYDIKQR